MFLFDEKKAKQVRKRPEYGEYSLELEELNWESCRERFSKSFKQTSKGLYFSCSENKRENIRSFIEKTEEILISGALIKMCYSKFYKTNLSFAIRIEPSDFWMNCSMKRSLFTMLLRCGISYDFKNYEAALFSTQYSKITKNALIRFLYGFTEYNDSNQIFEGLGKGWVSLFSNLDNSSICEKLNSKEKNTKLSFGDIVLWS
jgi:hypothetical protein